MTLNTCNAGIQKLSRGIYWIIEGITKLIFIVMVISVSIAVVGRFVFSKSPSWTEEIGILSLVWLCFLTATMGIRDGSHMRMTIIEYIFPKKVTLVMHKIAYVVLIAIHSVFIGVGIEAVLMMSKSVLPATGLPLSTMYSSILISGVFGLIMAVARLTDKECWKS